MVHMLYCQRVQKIELPLFERAGGESRKEVEEEGERESQAGLTHSMELNAGFDLTTIRS